jgi:MFS family permease
LRPAPRLLNRINSFFSLERNVVVMSLTALLINFGYQSFQIFLPLYLRTLEAGIPEIGLVFSAILFATASVSIVGGLLADKFGRKIIIVLGTALGFAIYFALLEVTNWTVALIILFAAAIFSTLVQPAASSTVAESVKTEDRSYAFGTFLFFTSVGLALGGLIGGFFSNRIDILLVGSAGVTAALLRILFLKETLPRDARANRVVGRRDFFAAHMGRNVWLLLLAISIFYFASGLGQPVFAIFSTDVLHLTKPELGIMVGIAQLSSMLASFWAGRVSKKLGVIYMMVMAVIVGNFLLIPWLYAPNLFFAVGLYTISGFFSQFFFVGNQALMANLTRAEERASVIGFITTISNFASILAPSLGAQLYVELGTRVPFLISAMLAVAVAIPLTLIREQPLKSECPHCGRKIPETARYCDMCGKPVNFVKCSTCGRELEKGVRFCDACGRDQLGEDVLQY